jgi:uncharacterized membrane protein
MQCESTAREICTVVQSLKDQLLELKQDLREIQKRMEEVEKQLTASESDSEEIEQSSEVMAVQPTDAEQYQPPSHTKPVPSQDADPELPLAVEQTPPYWKSRPEPSAPSVESKAREQTEPSESDIVPESASPIVSEAQTEPLQQWEIIPSVVEARLSDAGYQFGRFVQHRVLGGNLLAKAGIMILFLGLAFALRYAAELGLLPIWLRYFAVAAAGFALLVLGWRWRKREDTYGLIMQGGGIAVLYLTTLAAMKLHPLLALGLGFTILVLIAALAAALSVIQNAFVLAVIASLGGFAAPVLASTGEGNHIILFSYLTVLNLGLVSIAWFKSWRTLNIIGYVSSFGLGSAWAVQHYSHELFWSTEPFLLLLFGIYVLITFLFARRTLADMPDTIAEGLIEQAKLVPKPVRYVDGSLAFGVPFSAFWLQHYLVEPFEYGAAISAAGFGVFYFLIAYLLVFRTQKRYALLTETLVVLGAVFGTLAIPLLETPWTAAAWAAEAAGVYWIGFRQHQTYVRFIALAVLLGSALYFLPELRFALTNTVLEGPTLSALLLTVSTGITYWLISRVDATRISVVERRLRPFVVAFGGLMLATIPLLLFAAEWAGPVLAVLGTGLIFTGVRWYDNRLLNAGWTYQFAGGGLFLFTLQGGTAGAVLADGWAGLTASCLVGVTMLAAFGMVKSEAEDLGTRMAESNLRSASMGVLALLAGLAFINLAPLFILPWRYSAMVWPIAAVVIAIWAIHAREATAILFAFFLQLLAGLAHLQARGGGDIVPLLPPDAAAFLNSGFIGPVVIVTAGLFCARIMHRDPDEKFTSDTLGWVGLVWAGLWWGFAWYTEITRVAPALQVTAAFTAITIITAWLMRFISSRLDWPQLLESTAVYLPVLVLIALDSAPWAEPHPLAGWAAVTWPAALIMHGFLLRWQKAALDTKFLELMNVLGAWLFILIATLELRWWVIQWSDPASAWRSLGTVLVPLLYIWALTRERIQSLWPVCEYRQSYVLISAIPVVIYLAGWLWVSNMSNSGNAQPLPYVPLFNPLEIAYLATMLISITWWRMIHLEGGSDDLGRFMNFVLVVTAFALLTGGIIRACHHWANIPWQLDALLTSYTVQTSLSIVWGLLAISLMLFGNRRYNRSIWLAGGILVAVVVAKLFTVELSASGTVQRIVSFIGVGLLLLLVGYIAPLPPRKAK